MIATEAVGKTFVEKAGDALFSAIFPPQREERIFLFLHTGGGERGGFHRVFTWIPQKLWNYVFYLRLGIDVGGNFLHRLSKGGVDTHFLVHLL